MKAKFSRVTWYGKAIALMILVAQPGIAQTVSSAVNIVSPSDGTTVSADQTLTVSVAVDNSVAAKSVQLIGPAFGISDMVVQAPYNFSVAFSHDGLGPQKVTVMAISGSGEALFSKTIILSVVPASSLVSLSTDFTNIPFSFVGETARVHVAGKFADGSSADVTTLSSTKFSSQSSTVATVDSSGNVVATGTGKTTITVQNGTLAASVSVSVPTTIRGDLNGDGNVDQDDLNLLIAAVGMPATGPFDARALDGAAIIDNRDVQILEGLCSPSCIPGGHILPVNAVVNAASFAANSLAPGALFTIFTSGLSVSIASAAAVPLPTSLGGVSIQVNGVTAPLLYVSPTQMNVQMPVEIAPGSATLTLTANGSSSANIKLNILPAAPGIFLYSGSRAVVQNQDYSLNSSTNPAKVGDTIIAYLTGQGSLDKPVSTGNAAPSDTLSRTSSATTATIGGLPAQVMFSGLAPGFVGLGQANIGVPNLPPGDYPLVITVGGVASNAGTISVSVP